MNWKKSMGSSPHHSGSCHLQACDQKVADTTQASQKLAEPITVKHALGTTVIDHLPQRVAVLDMNEADFLDQLNVPIMGMPKDYVPHF